MQKVDHLLETGIDVINQYITNVVTWIGTNDNLIVRNIQTDVYDTILIYGIICSIICLKSKSLKRHYDMFAMFKNAIKSDLQQNLEY